MPNSRYQIKFVSEHKLTPKPPKPKLVIDNDAVFETKTASLLKITGWNIINSTAIKALDTPDGMLMRVVRADGTWSITRDNSVIAEGTDLHASHAARTCNEVALNLQNEQRLRAI